MLYYQAMNNPAYFMSRLTPWDTWRSTIPSHGNTHYLCVSDTAGAHRQQREVEERHPGFIPAYNTLAALGCDKYFVTSVLKLCIIHASGQLDEFLASTELLKAIPTALAIGLTGDEFVAMHSMNALVGPEVALPCDMAFEMKRLPQ